MRLYTAKEVAATLGIHWRTVHRAVASGELAAVRSPSGYFMTIPADALRDWLASDNAREVLLRSASWSSRRRNSQRQPANEAGGSKPNMPSNRAESLGKPK